MQIIEAEYVFCFPRNCKATMVMFAGQKYRQFHGHPMEHCSIRKSVLIVAANLEFFAQECSTWISDQHRQDTPVIFDIFAF